MSSYKNQVVVSTEKCIGNSKGSFRPSLDSNPAPLLQDGANLSLTHYHTMPHFDVLKIYSCGKHCKKKEKLIEMSISPFPIAFSTLLEDFPPFSLN